MIACLIAVSCTVGFATIWFVTVHKELDEKRRNLESLREQLLMHEKASAQIRDGPDREVAVRMLETNQRVYREAARNYNRLLKKPMNCVPAFLMRFHPADESGNTKEAKQ